MEKLLTRKEAARLLGISIATLDAARANGLVSFVQYCENGSVYFTEISLQEYVARSTHKAKPREVNNTHLCPLGCPENTGPVFGTVISGTEGVTEDVGTMSNTEQGETHFT